MAPGILKQDSVIIKHWLSAVYVLQTKLYKDASTFANTKLSV